MDEAGTAMLSRQVTPHSGECDVTLATGIRNADYFSPTPAKPPDGSTPARDARVM
jgi:hypothetical protein